jgi:hypothetical protein
MIKDYLIFQKKIFFTFFIFIILNLNYSHSQTTGDVKGIVKDSSTGESIPYASIRITNSILGINTNVNGTFILKGIPAGLQEIQATSVGYKKVSKLVNITGGEISTIIFILSPEPIEMQTVTKSVNRIKEAYETNISINSISKDELDLIPATLEKDVFRALKIISGISTTGDISNQFYVRGGGGDQNLILFDNMIIYNPFHALGLFGIFNSDAIKVSEVMTGGFGAEYGGKLSSVINIISRDGNRNHFNGKFNFGLLSGQTSIEGPIPNGAFFLAFRKSYFDKILNKFFNKSLPLSFYDFSGKVTYDISDLGKVSGKYLFSGDNIKHPKISEPDYFWANNAFGININSIFESLLFSTSFSYSSSKSSLDPKGFNNKSGLKTEISSLLFNFKTEYYLRNNDLISFGVTALNPTSNFILRNNADIDTYSSGDIEEKIFWLSYKLTQIKDFVIEAGIRNNLTDVGKVFAFLFEPRLNLKYKILKDLALKASFTRMHQTMITTSNEDDIVPLFEGWIPVEIKDPLSPERADQFVIGIDGNPIKNLEISFLGYYKNISNYLSYNINKSEKDDPNFSTGSGKSWGVETSVKLHSELFFGWLTYCFSKTEITKDGYLFPPRYDKTHNLNMLFGVKLPLAINLNLHWEFSSGMPFTPIISLFDRRNYPNIPYQHLFETGTISPRFGYKNSERLPAYHKLDLSISKHFILTEMLKINLNIDIINLYDQKNIFFFDYETGERENMLPFLPTLSLGIEI